MLDTILSFLIYAFLGWCLEVVYSAVTTGRFVNRGFLNGPYCPVYGFGMILILLCLTPLRDSAAALFAGAAVLTSALEWITGFVLEKAFQTKWWDYSGLPFNLNGYICLKFSLLWGLAALIAVDAVDPLVSSAIGLLPLQAAKVLAVCGLLILAADTVLTVASITKMNRHLRHLEELGLALRNVSDSLGENIFEGVSDLKERNEKLKKLLDEKRRELETFRQGLSETREQLRGKLAEAEELLARYESALKKKYPGQSRLFRAFPFSRHTRSDTLLRRLREDLYERKNTGGGG